MATQKVTPFAVPSQSSPEVDQITQYELETLILLRSALKQRGDQLAAIETDLKARLEAGAVIEAGVHVAALKESFRRNVSWRDVAERLADRLLGSGRGDGYCAKVLSSTKPNRTVSLDIA